MWGNDGCINADDLALVVQKRASGVTVINRGVGLDNIVDNSTILGLDRTAERTDDPCRHRAIQSKWIADGKYLLPDLKTLRCTHGNRCHAAARYVNLDDGEVIVGIRPHNLRLMFRFIGQRDFKQFGVSYDVIVSDDVTLRVDDSAGTHARLRDCPEEKVVSHAGGCDVDHSYTVLLIDVDVVAFIVRQRSRCR